MEIMTVIDTMMMNRKSPTMKLKDIEETEWIECRGKLWKEREEGGGDRQTDNTNWNFGKHKES